MAKPLMYWACSGAAKTNASAPTPNNPSPATAKPITEPPPKATSNAAPAPSARAASLVRQLALVAACMPMNPAAIEQIAPAMKHSAVSTLSCQAMSPATTITKIDRIWYSRRRKAIAPSWINPATSCMLSLPGDLRPTAMKLAAAKARPNKPMYGIKSAILLIKTTPQTTAENNG